MDDVVIKVVGDVTDINAKLDGVKSKMGAALNPEAEAALKRAYANTTSELTRLNAKLKEEIALGSKNVPITQKRIATLQQQKSEMDKLTASTHKATTAATHHAKEMNTAAKSSGGLGGAFKKLGGMMLAAFSIGAVTNFIKTSMAGYKLQLQAETALKFALKGREEEAERLIKTSNRLMFATNIPDETILQAQAFLAINGRTEEQINTTITAAIGLSKVLGTDLQTAVVQLNGTYEGSIGRLAKLDGKVKTFSKSQLEAGAAVSLFAEKYKGLAEGLAQTDSGKLESITIGFEELKDAMGARWTKDFASASGVINRLTRDLTQMVEVKASEELSDQRMEVNALTLSLVRGNLPAEERNKIYGRLKMIAPDIVKDIDLENISTVALTNNLRLYNQQMINKIVVTKAWEKAESAAQDAADDVIDKIEIEQFATTELLEIQDALNKKNNTYGQILEIQRKRYELGTISLQDYIKSGIEARKATDEFGLFTRNDGIKILTSYLNQLNELQSDITETTKSSADELNNYTDIAKKYGITITDATASLNAEAEAEALAAKNAALFADGEKDVEKAAKDAEKAIEEQKKKVEEFTKKLSELYDKSKKAEITGVADTDKIAAEGDAAITEVLKFRQELYDLGVAAFGKEYQLSESAQAALLQLKLEAQQLTREQLADYYAQEQEQQNEYWRQVYTNEQAAFDDQISLAEKKFNTQQEIEQNYFEAVQHTEQQITDFTKKQTQERINFQIDQAQKQIDQLKSTGGLDIVMGISAIVNKDKITELETQIAVLLSELGKSEKIEKAGGDLFDEILSKIFKGQDKAEIGKIKEAFSSIFSDVFQMISQDMATDSEILISAIDKELQKIDELLAAKQDQVNTEKQLAEDGKANNYAIRAKEFEDLLALQKQQEAARDAAIAKAKEQEKTLATIKAAAAFIVVLAEAAIEGGVVGVITGLAAGITLLAYMASAYGRASEAVNYGAGTAQILGGQPHSQGGTPLGTGERGEFFGVLRKDKTSKYGQSMLSLFEGINKNDEGKKLSGLAGLMGMRDISTNSTQTIELKEMKEVKEIRDIMKQPGKSVTYEKGKRIEKSGNHTRIIYVN